MWISFIVVRLMAHEHTHKKIFTSKLLLSSCQRRLPTTQWQNNKMFIAFNKKEFFASAFSWHVCIQNAYRNELEATPDLSLYVPIFVSDFKRLLKARLNRLKGTIIETIKSQLWKFSYQDEFNVVNFPHELLWLKSFLLLFCLLWYYATTLKILNKF